MKREQATLTEQRHLTGHLLISGGDARLTPDAVSGVNKYGCSAYPEPLLAAFGSSTASPVSERGFAAAQHLHQAVLARMNTCSVAAIYKEELERLRHELIQLCGLSDLPGIATIFAASGTDLHLIIAQLLANTATPALPLRIIMMDAAETGSGVVPALHGQHFSNYAALGSTVPAMQPVAGAQVAEIVSIRLRCTEGEKRDIHEINQEIEQYIQEAENRGQPTLLISIDISKTGLLAPGPDYLAGLLQRHPHGLDILVDACQFRLSERSLHAYLRAGFMVALTGSKFLTGPSFCGALLIPPNLTERLSQYRLPVALNAYSVQAEWPEGWAAARDLNNGSNLGLLLRWEAAMAELRAFRTIPSVRISQFLRQFADVVHQSITATPLLEAITETDLQRHVNHNDDEPAEWDTLPTIFPFFLHQDKRHTADTDNAETTASATGLPLNPEQTRLIYQQLQMPSADEENQTHTQRYQLGQPVLCGTRQGIPVSALRLCASSRLITEACGSDETATEQVLQRVRDSISRIIYLIRLNTAH